MTCMIYIAFRTNSHEWLQYTWKTISNWLLNFTFQTMVVITFFRCYKCQIHKLWNTDSNWYVLKQNLKEIFLMSWLTANAKLKTSGNFVKGSQPQNWLLFLKKQVNSLKLCVSLALIGFHLFWSFKLTEMLSCCMLQTIFLESVKLTWRGQIKTTKVKLSQCSL